MEEGSARLSPERIHGAADKVREARRFDEMAKRKKRIATVNRKLCRVQKPNECSRRPVRLKVTIPDDHVQRWHCCWPPLRSA
jgi:hypothetical protein